MLESLGVLILVLLILFPIISIPLSAFLEHHKKDKSTNLIIERELKYELLNIKEAPTSVEKILNTLITVQNILKFNFNHLYRYYYQHFEEKYIVLYSKQADIHVKEVRGQYDNIYIIWSKSQPNENTLTFQGYYYKVVKTNIFFDADVRLRQISDKI
ncbi:hypothetical protein [Schinkia azotoformans]|uniref:hypothetical protein n=1 Tax=Schinkia azotoformans TaxID=1454 RepID=UPI002DBE4C26|nr:hypothetical protein [Schinkia azotoformans]MEC1772368.1 hypothetical protein [Schinkia azotoformans]MED4365871.1 hypothetical protein [Schinkia azotoformans]